MKSKWEMSIDAKNELVKLAKAASQAHGAVLRANNPKNNVNAEERKKLELAKTEAQESLKKAVTSLNVKQVVETAGWMQRLALNSIEPMGQGKVAWNQKNANQLSGALKSFVSAIEAAHSRKDERSKQANNYARTTHNVVRGIEETDFYPRDGKLTLTYRDTLLVKVDEKMMEAKTAGNMKLAMERNELCGWIKSSTSYFKPANPVKSPELPRGCTLNGDTTKGPATLGETMQPVAEPAPAAVVKAETATPVKAEAGTKPKDGKKPFKNDRPGAKKAK